MSAAHAAHGSTEGHPMPSGGRRVRQPGIEVSTIPQSRQQEHTARHSTEGSRTQRGAVRGGMWNMQQGVADGPTSTARFTPTRGWPKAPPSRVKSRRNASYTRARTLGPTCSHQNPGSSSGVGPTWSRQNARLMQLRRTSAEASLNRSIKMQPNRHRQQNVA